MAVAVSNPLRINISKDRLTAHLIVPKADFNAVTVENFTAKMLEAGMPKTPQIAARIEEVVKLAQSGSLPNEPILIIEGKPPVPGVSARIDLINAEKEADLPEGSVDFRQSQIMTVKENDKIGLFTPAIAPQPGLDVFNNPIAGNTPAIAFQLGDNVRLAEDRKTVLAAKPGKVQVTRASVSVIEVVEISGDVDYGSGNIESPTDVMITGTVRDTFSVTSAKSISIKGAVEGAILEAGTHIHIAGGVAAHNAGRIKAGGEVCAKYCGEADIESTGDVTITRQVMNSRVWAGGRLIVDRGSAIGGSLYAREGAQIRNLGNEANVHTEIAIGVCPKALAQTARIDEIIKKKQEAAKKIRETVQPLLVHLKRLTPQQRERATELMYEADRIDEEVGNHEKEKQAIIAASSPAPGTEVALLVTQRIYPGVTVIFGNKMALMLKERRGPVRIVRQLINRVEEILIIDQISGSVTTLPSCEYVPNTSAAEQPAA